MTAPLADPPRASWRHLRAALELWFLLLIVFVGIGVYQNLRNTDSPWLREVAPVFPEALVVLVYCRLREPGLLRGLLRPFPVKFLLPMTLVGFGLLGVENLYLWLIRPALGPDTWRLVDVYLAHGWPLWTPFVFVALIPAFFEELAFRGFIQTRLERILGARESLVVQAGMFAVLHLEPDRFVTTFLFGVGVGWLRRFTGSLVPGMILHAVWNAGVVGWELGWF